MADLIKIIKSDLYDYRWSVDGNKYGESYDITTQDGFSDPTLEKEGWERVLKVNGSLFYTYDSAHYARGLEKAFGSNHQDASMTAVSDYNDAMAIACLEDGQFIFDKQSNIIANYLDSAYGAITGLGVLLQGKSVDMHTGFDTQWDQISGRTVIGVDSDGNYLSYSFAGTTGSGGLTGEQVQSKCIELGFYNAIMLDGGGSVFREYFRSYDISSTRSVKNALMLYRKRKANPFIPRTSKTLPSDMTYTSGVTNWNRWWYEDVFNAGATASVCLPNCTTYAMGRSGEIANKSCRDNEIMNRTGFPDASDWFSNAKWETGQTPKLGAIACWTDNGNNWGGHVAVVEETDGTNANTKLSMSGYQAASSGTRSFTNPGKDASWYFQYLDFETTNYYYTTYDDRGGSFLGYIYNPYIGDSISLPQGVSRDKTKNQIKLNTDVTLKVRIDPSTNSKIVSTMSASDSYYDVLSIYSDDDYTWYQIGEDNYVADNGSWVTYYEEESINYYTISALASPEDGGSIEGAGVYEEGTTCILKVTPSTNYIFNNWSDGNTDNPRSIIVTDTLSLTANFTYITPTTKYKVTTSILPEEAIEAGCTVTGSGEYEINTVVTLTATAASGYKFVSWNDGQTTNSISINVTRDIEAIATFEKDTAKYTITTECDYTDFGTMEGAGVYEAGEEVTLNATITNSNYEFDCWYIYEEGYTIALTAGSIKYTYTPGNNCRCVLSLIDKSNYREIKLSVNDASMGAVNGAGEYKVNSQVSISAMPNDEFMFVKWSDGNTSPTRSFVLTDDVSLIAYFAKSSSSATIIQINGDSAVTENLNASFVNYNRNYTYNFYYDNSLWGTSTDGSINLLINNDFEAAMLTTTSQIFNMDVEAVDSDGSVREYQRNIPFTVTLPESFGVSLKIISSEGLSLFKDLSIAGFSRWVIKYEITQTAPTGYTNHATLNELQITNNIGNVIKGNNQVTYVCTSSKEDYNANITFSISDNRGSAQLEWDKDVKGYHIPTYTLRQLELQEATKTKYNCFVSFNLDYEGSDWRNNINVDELIVSCDGTEYTKKVTWDDYKGWYYALVGDSNLSPDISHEVIVKYRDLVLATLSTSTWYTATQFINSKLPLSLYDDTVGNVGVAFGEQSDGENIIKMGMETTFGTGVQLNASKYDNKGNLLEVSKDAYDLLNGDWDAMVRWDNTNGKYANRIACMTGAEYRALTSKDDHVLYFLTSVPN